MGVECIPVDAVCEEYRCMYCLFPVKTYWVPNNGGMLSSPDYVLMGDGVAHGVCFDRALEDL